MSLILLRYNRMQELKELTSRRVFNVEIIEEVDATDSISGAGVFNVDTVEICEAKDSGS